MGDTTASITDTGFGTPFGKAKINDKIVRYTKICPAPRSRHCAVLFKNFIILYGGGGKNKIFDDLWTLDTTTMEWSQPKVSGQKPSPRWGHTATLVNDKMYVFGGVYENKMLDKVFELDIREYLF